jgi:hypothetical protein
LIHIDAGELLELGELLEPRDLTQQTSRHPDLHHHLTHGREPVQEIGDFRLLAARPARHPAQPTLVIEGASLLLALAAVHDFFPARHHEPLRMTSFVLGH